MSQLCQQVKGFILRRDFATKQLLVSLQGTFQKSSDVVWLQRFQDKNPGAGEQGGVDFKGGVFRCGSNQDDVTVFDPWQKRILLGLVETMDLVDKQQGASTVVVAFLFRFCGDLSNPGGQR